jgi:hypothetical protein
MPGLTNGIGGNSGKEEKIVYLKNPINQTLPIAVLVLANCRTYRFLK